MSRPAPAGDPDGAGLLRLLPDAPRWVEVRGMLIAGACDVIALHVDDGLSCVVRERESSGERGIFVIGDPGHDAIRTAVEPDPDCVVIATPEDASRALAALPGWSASRAILHTLATDESLPPIDPADDLRPFSLDDLELIRDEMPPDLSPWLRSVVTRGGERIAAWADGKPVSFCCSLEPSERFWDVAIDTLPDYQRRGLAATCAAWMIARMREKGREPVWGAEETNVASMMLAKRLGFAPVDELILLTPAAVD